MNDSIENFKLTNFCVTDKMFDSCGKLKSYNLELIFSIQMKADGHMNFLDIIYDFIQEQMFVYRHKKNNYFTSYLF